MAVLITGGAGFIGSHLAEDFCAEERKCMWSMMFLQGVWIIYHT